MSAAPPRTLDAGRGGLLAPIDIRASADLILYKTYAELRVETERTYLGVAWWVLEPFINMLIFYVVFGVFFKARGAIDNFVPFLLIGVIMWQWFGATVPQCAYSIQGNAALIRQIASRKIVFPIIAVLVNTAKFAVALGVLFAFLWVFGEPPTLYYAAVPVLLAVELLAILAVGLLMAAVVPFFPDVKRIIDHVLRIMFFMSGIFYDIDTLAGWMQRLLLLNPMAVMIRAFRAVLMYEQWPDWRLVGALAAASCVGIYVGAWLIHRLDRVYAKRILE